MNVHTCRVACACAAGALLWSGAPLVAQSCEGRSAGALVLSEWLAAVFVVQYTAAGPQLEALFLARGDSGWTADDNTFRPRLRPQLPDTTRFMTGASVGRLFMQYEPKSRTGWVHTTPVSLTSANVVVIERAHADQPSVRTVFAVDPAIEFAHACTAREQNDFAALRQAVLQKLWATPELRRLLEPPRMEVVR